MNLSFETVTSFTHGGSGLPAVAVAGAADDAVLGAVDAGLAAGIGFFLVGNNDEILKTAGKHGLNLGDAVIVDSKNSDEAEICRIAAGLCAEGKAGVLMKGLVGTASFTRAILDKEIGLTEKGSLLSHIGFFAGIGNGKAFLITDAAINILPDVEAKKKILGNAVGAARALGILEPKIALLAPVEKISSKIQSTVDAAELKSWLNGGALGNVVADGPFALDVAASREAARIKGLNSPVAGDVDIYFLPNLDAGNVLYKSLTVFSGASSAGILSGAKVPVVLTSRSDTEEVKIASLGLALQIASSKG
ncbi:MAG: phosphate butyryltransferase [Spirochaetaceae bacterium]|nr:phosphate butyryltransferase [Spirochaetaceae bacterium]